MRVKWLRQALRNLKQAHNYVFPENPTAAQELILKIQNAANQLENYPFMGKSGRVDGTRELIISNSPYMIIYRVKEETVEILRILHTSKRYPE
ncbi:type II toxin-antitoxin system mRNA interferase toxin, RelE/StbE family [Aphanizomenon sp. PH219]|jgi:toxin ParE1/3/4|uniref:Type II toxin-antitoxin system mRNA interferase toxin, RelE/StbE family n=1 Tax=Dolichospermum heterosporum TAC447 TaxID=747523 RepID=A0ABY5M1H7_9CYAN|nr:MULTISPECIES: type II toxin-antitoxin system mRNA interferase toxin, RelE/StbE family [Aphanizomenonaceae]MDK2407957.1 type II toxin-antitoxin system mRNA interferase toxin, RelE/StbE family [Aphanizomenon sp. 202]MDK2459334.1 type II toxin-antitoxin system mRNA interferase toxin, RelE/StbE family [Aphanizomenon sp. PH219]UUO16926.1 type II toxin-antitoxin system mRNA interferase toxin, RelE/StbE family [Dolichospermum heterosporum TAC447]